MRTIDRWFRAGFAAALGTALVGCAAAIAPFLEGPPPTIAPPGAVMCENLVPRSGATSPGTVRDSVMAGRHRLIFPAGSTTAGNEPFRLHAPVAAYVVVQATPTGHQFSPTRGQLTISYAHCPASVTGPFGIYRWNDDGDRWEKVSGARSVPGERAMTVELQSLSEYALGSS